MNTFKKIICLSLVFALCFTCAGIVAFAEEEALPMVTDILYEQSGSMHTFGNTAPTAVHELMKKSYTAKWSSVTGYTHTNYRFTSVPKIKLTLNVNMVSSSAKGQFKVYLREVGGSSMIVYDSKTVMNSYSPESKTLNVTANKQYYFTIMLIGDGSACEGTLLVEKGK